MWKAFAVVDCRVAGLAVDPVGLGEAGRCEGGYRYDCEENGLKGEDEKIGVGMHIEEGGGAGGAFLLF